MADIPMRDVLSMPNVDKKFLQLIVWKVLNSGRHNPAAGKITIDTRDMVEFAGAGLVLLSHGHPESIDFYLVTPEEGKKLAAELETQGGAATYSEHQ